MMLTSKSVYRFWCFVSSPDLSVMACYHMYFATLCVCVCVYVCVNYCHWNFICGILGGWLEISFLQRRFEFASAWGLAALSIWAT